VNLLNKAWETIRGTAERRRDTVMGTTRIGDSEFFTPGTEGGLYVHYSEMDGCLGYHSGYIVAPDKMEMFVLEQFVRWNTGLPPQLAEIAQIGCHYALMHVDHFGPYFFVAYSDIMETSDCATHLYKVKPLNYLSHEFTREHIAPFEKLESFVYAPEQSESYFREFMSQRPSLGLFPFTDVYVIREEIDGGQGDDYCAFNYARENHSTEFVDAVREFFPTKKDYYDAVEFAAASALIWLASPLAASFRGTVLELASVLQESGECIVYDYYILSPDSYEKIPIPAKTCGMCGLHSFCVEMSPYAGTATMPVCNFCISGRQDPIIREATCGSRFCKYIECPNHLFGGQGRAGYFKMVGQYGGQLKKLSNGYEPRLLN
jgi:hypothetical protein